MNSDKDDIVPLLEAAESGDDVAAEKLFQRYQSFVECSAKQTPASAADGKVAPPDVIQQSLLKAFRSLSHFRAVSDIELQVWMSNGVVINREDAERFHHESQQRNPERRGEMQGDAMMGREKTASSKVRELESSLQLWKAIERLPVPHQQLVELRHRDGLSFKEIAHRLNMTEAAVRRQWSKSLDELRKSLES